MTHSNFEKYKFKVWLVNLIILLPIIIILIGGFFNKTVYYIFLSEQFPEDHLGFLKNFLLGLFYPEGPIILPLIGLASIVIWANLEVFYKDRYGHEKKTGTYESNRKKRAVDEKKVYSIFKLITLINILLLLYLGNKLLFGGENSVVLENIAFVCLAFLPINIGITIGLGISKK